MDPTECYTCEGANRDLNKGCACNDGYYQDTDKVCKSNIINI